MIYLFDPAMSESRATNVKNRMGASNIEYDNPLNGVYVSQYTMDNAVKPREALVLTYDGCYTGGSNVCRSTSDGLSEGGMTYEQAIAMKTAAEGEDALTEDKSASKQLLQAIMNAIKGEESSVSGKYIVLDPPPSRL